MKKLSTILVVIAILFVGIILVKNQLANLLVTASVSQVTGAPVHIDSFGFGIFRQAVSIKGFKLYNPQGFPREILLDISEMNIQYDLPALLKGKFHAPLIVLDINELVVIKNKEGKLNVDSLKVTQQAQAAKEAEKSPEGAEPSKPLAIQIDLAKLNIGRVVLKDYSKGEPPTITAYDIHVKDKTYKNITNVEQFVVLILVEAMGPTAIRSAGLYSAASILGVGFLPAGIVGVLIGKDSGINEFNVSFEAAYKTALSIVQEKGKVTKQDQNAGFIQATVDKASVKIEVKRIDAKKTQIKVSARKNMIPRPEIAEGLLYQISEKLK